MAASKDQVIEELLVKFGNSGNLDEKLSSLTGLIKLRTVHASREDERFIAGLNSIERIAETSSDHDDRLLALAALGRIGTVKSLRNRIENVLVRILERSIPSVESLKDPDDRYYVASVLHLARGDWVIPYVSDHIVNEKQAEKARQEFVDVLVQRESTLADVFQHIAVALKELKPETQNPGDSVARRLERIIIALRPKIVSVLIAPGDDLGKTIQNLFTSAFVGVQAPETLEVTYKTAEEATGLVHDIIRTQISTVTDPSIYASIAAVRMWFPKDGWRIFSPQSESVQRLIRNLLDAMTLLAKQQITDIELFDQLIQIVGTREKAMEYTAEIASRHPELDAEVREWLKKGGKIRTTRRMTAFDESEQLSADPLIAMLMSNAERFANTIESTSEDALAELRIIEPSIAEIVELIINRGKGVLQGVTSLAKKRGLRFRGNIGDVVDYSPTAHELVASDRQGIRKVKIIRPMVERVSAGGTEQIVLKALVEPAQIAMEK